MSAFRGLFSAVAPPIYAPSNLDTVTNLYFPDIPDYFHDFRLLQKIIDLLFTLRGGQLPFLPISSFVGTFYWSMFSPFPKISAHVFGYDYSSLPRKLRLPHLKIWSQIWVHVPGERVNVSRRGGRGLRFSLCSLCIRTYVARYLVLEVLFS